jgi:hypothetical protein
MQQRRADGHETSELSGYRGWSAWLQAEAIPRARKTRQCRHWMRLAVTIVQIARGRIERRGRAGIAHQKALSGRTAV